MRAVDKVLFFLYKGIHLPQSNPNTEASSAAECGWTTTSFENEEEKIQGSEVTHVDQGLPFSRKLEKSLL